MPEQTSTGITGLDAVLNRLQKGDNVVWQVDSIDDFAAFVAPFVKTAISGNHKVIYMRFASHKPLVEPSPGVEVFNLDASSGFELFSTQVHSIISEQGIGAYYVFDCPNTRNNPDSSRPL